MANDYLSRFVGKPTVQDAKSGFLVFLIALPLCLGISMASGFPPVAGILTAVIGGILVSFIGGARLTIKGPAAGLIVIAIGSVQELGQGDMWLGYKRTLAVGVAAACIQILFSFVRAATIGIVMSPSVVHGMLAAIGVIIIAKQAHVMLGVVPDAKEPLQLLAEIPHSILHANPEIMLLGVLSLAILIILPRIKVSWVKLVPAPIVVLLLTVPLSLYFGFNEAHSYTAFHHQFQVGPKNLVQLPGSIMDVITFPDFSMVFTAASIKYIVMFALIGTIESTLSVLAVDAMDPRKSSSSLNADLFATGSGNLLCAMLGGLPMISEIVRSKANIDAGAQTRWSNFFHGVCLLLFVALLPGLLSMIPLAVLAAMLVFTGARLASFSQLLHAKEIGRDQLFLFSITLIMTLATDLLIGVATGLILKMILHKIRGASLRSLFSPRIDTQQEGGHLTIKVRDAATFSCILPIRRQLLNCDDSITHITIDLSDATLVDHTFLSRLESMQQELPKQKMTINGLHQLTAVAEHPHSARLRTQP